MKRALTAALFLVVALSGCLEGDTGSNAGVDSFTDVNNDGSVVIAVIDSGSNPYHFDFLADHMPQHLNDDSSDDVPLNEDPATWLTNHPGADGFASYDALNLNLTPNDEFAVPADLHASDLNEWAKVTTSDPDNVHMTWIPGTKVVGWVNFGSGDGWAAGSHGVGSSSVSVGNIHGSCPECLLVFVNGLGEEANRWVESQDWIDAQTNSWGYSAGVAVRDRFYAGSDVESQREAVERGHAVFFSAGNGLGNTFTAPNPTLFSSQEGPDWIITVGAVTPTDGSSYTGHGKPADVASVGSNYASAGGATVTDESTFGGTSNATPVTAGMYGKALWMLRNADVETRKMQSDGVIVEGPAHCGEANPDCAAADGKITYAELRDALLESAQHTEAGYAAGLLGTGLPGTENSEEATFLAEGHGTFWGRHLGDEHYQSEVDRIVDVVRGDREPVVNPALQAWSASLSFCTQILWGSWDLGHDTLGVPNMDVNWPVRSWLTEQCPIEGPAIMEANHAVTDAHPLY